MLTRRTLSFLPFLGGLRPVFAQSDVYSLELGAMKLTFLSDGYFNLPLSVALPQLSKEEVAQEMLKAKADPTTQLMAINIVLIKTGTDLCLIDCGGGSAYLPTLGLLPKSLEKLGITAEQITKVIFTHAHPDHLWGVTDEFDELTFKNATYILPKEERDYWLSAKALSEAAENMKGIANGTVRRLKLLENKLQTQDNLPKGLSYLPAFGHSAGHCAVLCESNGKKLLLTSDSFIAPTFSFTRPEWEISADRDKAQAVATRKNLLNLCVAEKLPIHGYHLPAFGLGRIETQATAFRFIPSKDIL